MEDMAKTPFLEKRGDVWWFRLKVEKDLLSHYAPKTEFRFSLRTKDRKEAEAKARIESVRLDQEFASARTQLTQEPKRTIADAEIARLEALYYHQALSALRWLPEPHPRSELHHFKSHGCDLQIQTSPSMP